MNKKIAFVNPPYERIAPGYEFVRYVTNRAPSLGLLHLAAQVRQDGYLPTIFECEIQCYNPDKAASKIIADEPAYVGITLFTIGVMSAAEIARKIKQQLPDTVVIVGGPHISSMGVETMTRYKEFDYAVVGEGEYPLSELLESLEQKRDLSAVNGIIYRDQDGKAKQTSPAPILKQLDELPMPAWDLLPNFPDAYMPAIYDYPVGPVATIAASRGCPFKCRFCDTSTFGAQVRAYTPKVVFEMMQHLKEKYGVRHIMFVDDLFLASRIRVTELCHLLIESGLKMTWSCTARVDTVKEDLLKLMRSAGCWEISFGLETGSDSLLKKMDKAASTEKSEVAVKWTDQAGIRTKGLFMLGYPGETAETITATKDFIRRIPMRIMNLTKFTPYPGSPIYVDLYGTKIRSDHWAKMNGMNFVWAPEGMTIEELDIEYQKILSAFYRRPKMLWYYVKMTAQHPVHLYRLLKFGFGFLRAKINSYLSGRRGLLVESFEVSLD